MHWCLLLKDILQAFLDSNEPQSMVISPNIAGHLHIHTDWPSALRNKGVYFVKKEKTPIPEDEVINPLWSSSQKEPYLSN